MRTRLDVALAERKKLNARIRRRMAHIDRIYAEIVGFEAELLSVHDVIYQLRKDAKLGQIPKFQQPRS